MGTASLEGRGPPGAVEPMMMMMMMMTSMKRNFKFIVLLSL